MNSGTWPTREDLQLLARFDTPTICNVIELFDVRPRSTGYMDGRIRACFPELPPMVGYAVTATFRAASPPREGEAYAGIEDQLSQFADLPGPAVVVIQDLDDPPVAAVFGEVLCSTYQAFGAAGLVTSGAGRDLPQVRALEFPVFTSGTICSHGYCHFPQIRVPVRVGGITIRPGDLLHGDANGVTTIPREIATDVAKLCPRYVEAEQELIRYARSGRATVEGYREARARFQKELREIVASLRASQHTGS
jgi:4-hydroxy-4-methyl-2-oxoglutarate aldolase